MFRHNCAKHGHRFEARFEQRVNPMMERATDVKAWPDMHKTVYYSVYVHDICTRCGAVVKRAE